MYILLHRCLVHFIFLFNERWTFMTTFSIYQSLSISFILAVLTTLALYNIWRCLLSLSFKLKVLTTGRRKSPVIICLSIPFTIWKTMGQKKSSERIDRRSLLSHILAHHMSNGHFTDMPGWQIRWSLLQWTDANIPIFFLFPKWLELINLFADLLRYQ